MWLIVDWLLPGRGRDIGWAFVIAFYFWFYVCSFHWGAVRHMVGLVFWTSTLNMIAVGLFGLPPVFWWAYGWTIGMLPVVGWVRIAMPVWVATSAMFLLAYGVERWSNVLMMR